MNARVGIVDYAVSNLTSVRQAFRHLGAEAEVTRDPGRLGGFTHLVLPGVGSFATGMANLQSAGLVEPIRDWAAEGRPLIGLCLGMQLLSEEGEEFGPTAGLGLIPGRVVRMKPADRSLRLPHVGWNEVERRGESRLLAGLGEAPAFYFVHSFCYADPDADYVTGCCEYGGPQVAVIERENICGAQFHPEKSQKAGLSLLANFVAGTGRDA
jgi:imidazole glycerol-phosphate synthase subunit HisH